VLQLGASSGQPVVPGAAGLEVASLSVASSSSFLSLAPPSGAASSSVRLISSVGVRVLQLGASSGQPVVPGAAGLEVASLSVASPSSFLPSSLPSSLTGRRVWQSGTSTGQAGRGGFSPSVGLSTPPSSNVILARNSSHLAITASSHDPPRSPELLLPLVSVVVSLVSLSAGSSTAGCTAGSMAGSTSGFSSCRRRRVGAGSTAMPLEASVLLPSLTLPSMAGSMGRGGRPPERHGLHISAIFMSSSGSCC